MKDSRAKAWKLYNTQNTLNSEDIKNIVEKIPCDQDLKNDINLMFRYSETKAIDMLEEDIVPLMYLENMVETMNDVQNQKGGGRKKINPVISEFFRNHLRLNLSDEIIHEISELDFTMDNYDNFKEINVEELAEKAQEEVKHVIQKGGEIEEETIWKCNSCGYTQNTSLDKLCIECGTLNPDPSKTSFDKWCEKYPKVCEFVTKSMYAFQAVFKKIVVEVQSDGIGKLSEEEQGILNGLLEEYNPENILRMVFKRGEQLYKIMVDLKNFFNDFMNKSFTKIKDFLFFFFSKITGAVSYSYEKIQNMLFPRTYLSDPERIIEIMNNIDIHKHPEIYEKTLNIDVILAIRPEVLDYFIESWHKKGPETPVANLVKSSGKYVIEGTISIFKQVVSLVGNEIIKTTKTSNPSDGESDDSSSELTIEEARIAREQIRQQQIVYEYLNHLYEYLKNSKYFDSAPEVDNTYGTSSRYTITIYFFNMIMLFRSRWKYGERENGFELLDGGIETVLGRTYSVGSKVCSTISVLGMDEILKDGDTLVFNDYKEYDVNNVTATIVDKYDVNIYRMDKGYLGDYYVGNEPQDIDTVFKLSYTIPLTYKFQGKKYTQNYTVHKDDIKISTSRSSAINTAEHKGNRYSHYADGMTPAEGFQKLNELMKRDIFGSDESFFYKIEIEHKYEDEDGDTRTIALPFFIKDEMSTARFTGDSRCDKNEKSYDNDYIDCFSDPSKGSIPYDSSSEFSCPWKEGAPPLKTYNSWMNWIKNEESSETFINERISKVLFPFSDDIGCSSVRNMYSTENMQIDDRIKFKQYSEFRGIKREETIFGKIKSELRTDRKGNKFYNVLIDNEKLITRNGEKKLRKVKVKNIESIIDLDFTITEIKKVVLQNICKLGNTENINIHFLKLMLLLDYDQVAEYDTYKSQKGGMKSGENIYFTKFNHGNIMAINTNTFKAIAMNRKKVYRQMGGEDDVPDDDKDVIDASSQNNEMLTITGGPEQLDEKQQLGTKAKIKELYEIMTNKYKNSNEDDSNWGSLFENSSLVRNYLDQNFILRGLKRIISTILSLAFMLYSAMYYGASTVASYLFTLIKSSPTMMFWIGKVWKVILDQICDYFSKLYESTVDKLGKATGFWMSTEEKDKLLEKNIGSASKFNTIIQRNIKNLKDFWPQINRLVLSKRYQSKHLNGIVLESNASSDSITISIISNDNKHLGEDQVFVNFMSNLNLNGSYIVGGETPNGNYEEFFPPKTTIIESRVTVRDGKPQHTFNYFLKLDKKNKSGNLRGAEGKEIENNSKVKLILNLNNIEDKFKDIMEDKLVYALYNMADSLNDFMDNEKLDIRSQEFINNLSLDKIRDKSRGSFGITKTINILNDIIPQTLESFRPQTSLGTALSAVSEATDIFKGSKSNNFEFLNTSNDKSREDMLTEYYETLKLTNCKNIYPYLAKVIEVSETPYKPSFRYTSVDDKNRRMRAGNAIKKVFDEIFVIDINLGIVENITKTPGILFGNWTETVITEKRSSVPIFKTENFTEEQLNDIVDKIFDNTVLDKENCYIGLLNYFRDLCSKTIADIESNDIFSLNFKGYIKGVANQLRDINPLISTLKFKIGLLLKVNPSSGEMTREELLREIQTYYKGSSLEDFSVECSQLQIYQNIDSAYKHYLWKMESTIKSNLEVATTELPEPEGVDILMYKIIEGPKENEQLYNDFLENQIEINAVVPTNLSTAVDIERVTYIFRVQVLVPQSFTANSDSKFSITDSAKFQSMVSLNQLSYVENKDIPDALSKKLVRYNNRTGEALEIKDERNIFKEGEDVIVPTVYGEEISEYYLLKNFYNKESIGDKYYENNKKSDLRFSTNNIDIDLYYDKKPGSVNPKYRKLLPKKGDYVLVNAPSDFTEGKPLYINGEGENAQVVTYNKEVDSLKLIDSIAKQVHLIKDVESEIVEEEYFKKKRDERNARMEGITSEQRKWNQNRDLLISILMDNFDKETGKFQIDCVANDMCPRFAVNPGYFNIHYIVKNSYRTFTIGKGSLPEGAKIKDELNPKEHADLKYFFHTFNDSYYEKNNKKKRINRELLEKFVDFGIFESIDINKNQYKNELMRKVKYDKLSQDQKESLEMYQINGNFCDDRLPTLYEYLSTCNVYKKPGAVIKEPFPIQSSGIMIDKELMDKIRKMLKNLGIPIKEAGNWAAHRVVDSLLIMGLYKGLALIYAKAAGSATVATVAAEATGAAATGAAATGAAATGAAATGAAATGAVGSSSGGVWGITAGGPVAVPVLCVIGIAYGKSYLKKHYGVEFASLGNGIYKIGDNIFDHSKHLASYSSSSMSTGMEQISDFSSIFSEDRGDKIAWGSELSSGMLNLGIGAVGLLETALESILGASFKAIGSLVWTAGFIVDKALDMIVWSLNGIGSLIYKGGELVYDYILSPIGSGIYSAGSYTYHGINNAVDWAILSTWGESETLNDLSKKLSPNILNGRSLTDWLMDNIVPTVIKAHNYLEGKNQLAIDPFRAKYSNKDNGLIGGVITGLVNNSSFSEVARSTGASYREFVAEGAASIATVGIDGIIGGLQLIPFSNNIGVNGIQTLVSGPKKEMERSVKYFISKNIEINQYIDQAVLASQLFTNPCYLFLIVLGVKVPMTGLKAIKEGLKSIFYGRRESKKRQTILDKQVKEKLQDKALSKKEQILKLKLVNDCDEYMKDNLLKSESTINNLKTNITSIENKININKVRLLNYKNQNRELDEKLSENKNILESPGDTDQDTLSQISIKNESITKLITDNNRFMTELTIEIENREDELSLLTKRYQLLISYYPYSCEMLAPEISGDVAYRYYIGDDMELIKNNRIIVRILWCISIVTGIKFDFKSLSDKILLTISHPTNKSFSKKQFDVPYTFRNEILVYSYYNSTDIVILKTDLKIKELVSKTREDENHIKDDFLKIIGKWIYDKQIGIPMIKSMFNDKEIVFIPGVVTEFLRDINFFNEDYKNDLWTNMDESILSTLSPGQKTLYASKNIVMKSIIWSNRLVEFTNDNLSRLESNNNLTDNLLKVIKGSVTLSGVAAGATGVGVGSVVGVVGLTGFLGHKIHSVVTFDYGIVSSLLGSALDKHTRLVEQRKKFLNDNLNSSNLKEYIVSILNKFAKQSVESGITNSFVEYHSQSIKYIKEVGKKIKLSYVDYNTKLAIESYRFTKKIKKDASMIEYLEGAIKQLKDLVEIFNDEFKMAQLKGELEEEKEDVNKNKTKLQKVKDANVYTNNISILEGQLNELEDKYSEYIIALKAKENTCSEKDKEYKDLLRQQKYLVSPEEIDVSAKYKSFDKNLREGVISRYEQEKLQNPSGARSLVYRVDQSDVDLFWSSWLDVKITNNTYPKIREWLDSPTLVDQPTIKQRLLNRFMSKFLSTSRKSTKNKTTASYVEGIGEIFTEYIETDLARLKRDNKILKKEYDELLEKKNKNESDKSIKSKELNYWKGQMDNFDSKMESFKMRLQRIKEQLDNFMRDSYIHDNAKSIAKNIANLLSNDVYNCFKEYKTKAEELRVNLEKYAEDHQVLENYNELVKNKMAIVSKLVTIQTEFKTIIEGELITFSDINNTNYQFYGNNEGEDQPISILESYQQLSSDLRIKLTPLMLEFPSDRYNSMMKNIKSLSIKEDGSCLAKEIDLPINANDCPIKDVKLLKVKTSPDNRKNANCKEIAKDKFQYVGYLEEECAKKQSGSGIEIPKSKKVVDDIFVFF